VKVAFHLLGVLHPQLTQSAHGRYVGETILAKALHTTAFMVNTNQNIATHRFDVGTQIGQLLSARPIAAKQNQTACERMLQTLTVHTGQLRARDV
jgi:hypothetical protein